MSNFIISLDSGTTSARAVLFETTGEVHAIEQKEFTQIYPESGWVEHDPLEILKAQTDVLHSLLENTNHPILALGITNQRETTVVWDRETGKPIYHAIVWQDKRTAETCQELKASGLSDYCKKATGLVLDPYFSGTKIAWILDHVAGARERAERGELCFGTIDTWLLWNLTDGRVHATDPSNASRTLLYNIEKMDWDEHMLDALKVPKAILPEVKESASVFGTYKDIPIAAMMGDQQSALFGQTCFTPGTAKNTYGTGCFMLMNTGSAIPATPSGLLNTVAWQIGGETTYALEGSVFVAGAAIQWLRDGLKLIESSEVSEEISQRESDDHPDSQVVVVPAFAGLGTPYWDMDARGAVLGLTRDSGADAIIRAALESLAFQSMDVLKAMQEDSGISLFTLQVDGGASANNYLMQFQSDLLGVNIERPKSVESTAAGVALMAAVTMGEKVLSELKCTREIDVVFSPEKSVDWREKKAALWNDAVNRVRTNAV
ncbi:MAG: glycerol kinase [Euryarchaeota archaeon]|nr:glycerol kinase [Euryarchaeota archaeon]